MRRLLMLCLIAWLLVASGAAPAAQITPLDEKTVSVTISTSGKTRDEALRAAKEEAVIGAAGRVLLDDKLIRADELLEKYLRNYASRFVVGVEVLHDDFKAGRTLIDSRVFIDYTALIADLEEKRFLYSPAYKPLFQVFMSETLEGNPMSQEVARPLLTNALQGQGLRPYEGTLTDAPLNVDVSLDPLLDPAIVASELHNIEIVITGSTKTKLREEKKVYYDNFYFYDCDMEVKFLRVDTGEVLYRVSAAGSASNRDRAEAIRIAIDRAAQSIAKDVATEYRAFWPSVVQSKADYEILLTGSNDELVRIVSQHLDRLGRGTKIDVKKKFDGTAVLSVRTPVTREEILEVIRGCPYPTLTVVGERTKGHFEVQVAG